MACLDDIVTLGLCPDDGTATSGLQLIDAAGITLKNLANTATETYTSGVNMAMAKKRVATTLVRNDFIGALQSNNVVTTISNPTYDAAIFNTTANTGNYSGERGLNVYKVGERGAGLKSLYISEIQVYPLQSGDAIIKIIDGYKEYSYPVTFVANEVNTFNSVQLSGFPFQVESGSARILIDNTSFSFAKTELICHTGCNGNANPCGYVDGWNGTGKIKKDGFGINIKFNCECDYSKILCDLDKSFSGELIWLKWQIEIFNEQLKSNRFTSWVVYNRDELKDYVIKDLKDQYNQKWADLMAGMNGILKTYRDSCLNCKGIRWVSAI